jgi:hypothetical protein
MKKISLVGVMFCLLIVSVFVASAASSAQAPEGWCDGNVAWVVEAGAELTDPECGPGTIVVDVEGVLTRATTVGEAKIVLDGQAGTLWFEPQAERLIYLPLMVKAVTVPEGWCDGNVAWPVQEGAQLPNPDCGSGTVIVDVEGEQTRHAAFADAISELDGRAGTLWFEPALTAPEGFCLGSEPWPIPADSVLANPNCGSGNYAADIQGNVTLVGGFDEAVAFLNFQAGTFWFQPQ